MHIVLGIIGLVVWWAIWHALNQEHLKSTGVPAPSRKAMARIRRNARTKGITNDAAYQQWIVNKRRRMPKGSGYQQAVGAHYGVSEPTKQLTFAKAFPSQGASPIDTGPEPRGDTATSESSRAPAPIGRALVVLFALIVVAGACAGVYIGQLSGTPPPSAARPAAPLGAQPLPVASVPAVPTILVAQRPVQASAAETVAVKPSVAAPSLPKFDLPTILRRLRECLSITDGTKERLDCYDGVVRPDPKPSPPRAAAVTDCRFQREEDDRLICFNRFLITSDAARPAVAAILPVVAAPVILPPEVSRSAPQASKHTTRRGRGGCGSRGGPGYRLANGRCASWRRR